MLRIKYIILAFLWLWGMSFLCYGVYRYFALTKFKMEGEYVQGVVRDVEQYKYRQSGKRKMAFIHTVDYQDRNGVPKVFKGNGSNDVKVYPVGTEVRLVYDPNNPDNVKLYDWGLAWVEPLIFGFLGLMISLLGTRIVRAVFNKLESYDLPDKYSLQDRDQAVS